MTALKEAQLQRFLQNDLASVNGVLVNGADASAVVDVVNDIAAAFTKRKNGDVSRQRFSAASLKDDAGRLTDEMKSQSLFGGAQLIVVTDCDESSLKILEPLLGEAATGNCVLLEADALGKSSKLRQACEDSASFACLTLYEPDESDLKLLVRKKLAADHLSWAANAEQSFFDLVGSSRSIIAREAEKLALYCHGQKEVAPEDVTAICGDAAEFVPDELIDSVLGGDFETTERILASTDPTEVPGLLAQFQFHLQKLQSMRADMQSGATAESAVKRAKPPVFFKRQSKVIQQLNAIDSVSLEEMVLATANAIAATRGNSALSTAVALRHFFWSASLVRRNR